MGKLSLKKLERFVVVRNKSGHNSNLQFAFDADACGFDVNALGNAKFKTVDHVKAYYWQTDHGCLVEVNGRLSLSDKPYDVAIKEAVRKAFA